MDSFEHKQSSVRDFIHVIFKRKIQIQIVFIVTVCIAIGATFAIKPKYQATAQILVKIGRENFYAPPNSTKNQILNTNNSGLINSEIELLKSRSIAEKVIKDIGPQVIYKKINRFFPGEIFNFIQRSKATTPFEKALLKFEKALSIEAVKKSDVIEIGFKHPDPELSAKIVNTLAKVYLDEHLRVHKNLQSYDFFKNQSNTLKEKLEFCETQLETFKKENNVTEINEEQRLLLGQISDLRANLNMTISQEGETENRLSQIKKHLDLTPETISHGDEKNHNPYLISNLAAKLVELQIKERSLLVKYTPENRMVQNVKKEAEIVQDKLKEQESKRYDTSNIGPNSAYQSLKEDLYQNLTELKALSARKRIQMEQLNDFRNRIEALNTIEVRMDQLEEAVDINRQNYRLYLAKSEESRISDEMDNKKITNVSLMGKALSPLKPISPKILLNILLGFLMGATGGLLFAFITEYLDDSIEKPEDVEDLLNVPVLASILEY
ncbi:MAG: GumC family protein [Desulfobacterales bacterium]|nr:GumC family protein [Desulfobacterales bacterium]